MCCLQNSTKTRCVVYKILSKPGVLFTKFYRNQVCCLQNSIETRCVVYIILSKPGVLFTKFLGEKAESGNDQLVTVRYDMECLT